MYPPRHLLRRRQAARYGAAPTVAHYAAAKTVLRYLKGTLEWGLRYGARGGLVGYSDADFAGDVDTRRSTSGYVFVLNGAAVSCLSKVQPTVATSTMEAEYIASVQAAREAVWLKLLIKTLMRTDNAVPLRCDNQGALRLADHPGGTPRSKHIDVGHHFVRDRAARGDITLVYVPTAEMVADVLTKALPMALLSTCRHGLGLLALAPIGVLRGSVERETDRDPLPNKGSCPRCDCPLVSGKAPCNCTAAKPGHWGAARGGGGAAAVAGWPRGRRPPGGSRGGAPTLALAVSPSRDGRHWRWRSAHGRADSAGGNGWPNMSNGAGADTH